MVKISRNSMIKRRIADLKENIHVNTQRIREKTLNRLEELFDIAEGMAKSKNVKMKQRQIWARIAAYIAQIMNSVALSFDERQIDVQLDELERLVNEAKAKAKTKKTKRQVKGAKKEKVSKGSS